MASPPAGASLPRKRLPPETTPGQQRRPLLPCPLTPRRARSPRADGVPDVGPERELAEWRRLRGSGRERAPCQHPPGLSSRSPDSAHSSGLRTRKAFKTSNLRSASPTSNLNPPSASPELVKREARQMKVCSRGWSRAGRDRGRGQEGPGGRHGPRRMTARRFKFQPHPRQA